MSMAMAESSREIVAPSSPSAQAPRLTAEQVELELRRAVILLRRMPGGRPRSRTTYWPDYLYTRAEYGFWPTKTKMPPALALPAAISAMDKALSWLDFCTAEERVVVAARAHGLSWREMERGDRDGRCERTLRRIHGRAIAAIVLRLEGAPIPAAQPRLAVKPSRVWSDAKAAEARARRDAQATLWHARDAYARWADDGGR